MKMIKPIFICLACILSLAGCARTAAINNVNTSLTAQYPEEQLKTAILQAGLADKWIMTPAQPGVINGRLNLRTHQADIRITYNANGYKITYVASKNLLADGKGQIHRNYNNWISNLDRDIQLKLSAAH
ncbi:hypothetical protein [Acerihabitans arboris]|uniref:hypothetical protein n=1 Tax=Acerihabitans arboris TaxID=2691583 RepID=UPI001FE43247|nr:hypothetical protein [Acerihabitans arboris]